VPLVVFTSDPIKMGQFVNSTWLKILSWIVAAVIIALNLFMLVQLFGA
jgi:manganese transport protein